MFTIFCHFWQFWHFFDNILEFWWFLTFFLTILTIFDNFDHFWQFMTTETLFKNFDNIENWHNFWQCWKSKTVLETCDIWDTDYNYENLNSWQSLLPDNQLWHWIAFTILAMFFVHFIKSTKKSWHGSDCPPFWVCQGFGSACYCNPSLREAPFKSTLNMDQIEWNTYSLFCQRYLRQQSAEQEGFKTSWVIAPHGQQNPSFLCC